MASALGISDEHRELHATVGRWITSRGATAPARAVLDGGPPDLGWDALAEQRWVGLAVGDDVGGEGYGLAELAVVLEEMGRVTLPGPFLASALASVAIDRLGADEVRKRFLPGLCDGSRVGTVAFDPTSLLECRLDDGLTVRGTVGPVLAGSEADLFIVGADAAKGTIWCVLDRDQVSVEPLASLDPTRPLAMVTVRDVSVAGDRQFRESGPLRVIDLAAVLLAAEGVGGMAWCVDAAAGYAREREQFGRPIGQFQAVKHRCADMLLTLEECRAAAWDAVRGGEDTEQPLAAAVAGALVAEAAFATAKDCLQVHGGIGFTWEHDVHLFLRRATATRQLLGASSDWRRRVYDLAATGVRRTLAIDLPPEADGYRSDVRSFVAATQARPKEEWNRALADEGYLVPHWPEPWGLGAGAVHQLMIDEELAAARLRRPHLAVGLWVLPTLMSHGTDEQKARWIGPTMQFDISWCQLFSEPGAGSDLASLTTRAERTDGGWLLTGQKVWTTLAHQADWGICLARTDPEVPKHEGITCFMVDMTADGLDIRPLREITGQEMFNEVFLDAVFVPDDCVVGGVGNGWSAARTTLANERVSMGSGASFGPGVEAVLSLVAARPDLARDPVVADEVGGLVAESEAIAVMGLRMTLQALSGHDAGAESSVKKLLGIELDQRVQEVGLGLLGSAGAVDADEGAVWIYGFLGNRALSIAGGTSEVQRNVIAERLLDLPKDP